MTTALPRPPEIVAARVVWLPRRRQSAGKARVQLRSFLAEVEGGELYLEVGELVLAELVSNAVRHAHVPPGRLILARFELLPGLLRIEVHDASSEWPTVRAAEAEDEVGRGLWLVEQLSAGWGCCPRMGGIGKAVWCLVAPADHDAKETLR